MGVPIGSLRHLDAACMAIHSVSILAGAMLAPMLVPKLGARKPLARSAAAAHAATASPSRASADKAVAGGIGRSRTSHATRSPGRHINRAAQLRSTQSGSNGTDEPRTLNRSRFRWRPGSDLQCPCPNWAVASADKPLEIAYCCTRCRCDGLRLGTNQRMRFRQSSVLTTGEEEAFSRPTRD